MIIGITGTNGSGKGTVVDYLVAKGFKHCSAREFIVKEIHRRGLPVDRSLMREVANDLRKTHGPAYVVESLFTEARQGGGNAVIESVRAIAEAEELRARGAHILATDADRLIRYERIVARNSATDHVSFEEFCAQEDREMHATDRWDMNVAGVMQMADATLHNNGTLAELHAQVDAALERLTK